MEMILVVLTVEWMVDMMAHYLVDLLDADSVDQWDNLCLR